MTKSVFMSITALMIFATLVGSFDPALAGDTHQKLVIQVSDGDEKSQAMALNNAINVQKALGLDNVDIEVVAYGPGLSLLTKESSNANRVKSLSMQNISFSACGNTMKKIEEKTGKAPQLNEGVRIVEAGVVRIMELQNQGYAYIRP